MITYEEACKIVKDKLCLRTENRSYEELSEILFGEGNCFNESEVRKRMYGMKRLIEIIENGSEDNVTTRILSISDLHIPFQKPIGTFKKYKNAVDILQINGDVQDCLSISKFIKLYRVSPMDEIVMAREYLISLIEYLQPKTVVINYGNHDLRFQNYLAKNLDNELLELMPKTSLELIVEDGFTHYDKKRNTKVKYYPIKDNFPDIVFIYNDNWWSKIGNTIFCHPLSFSSVPMKTAENAMIYFHNMDISFDTLVMAHTHRVGEYAVGTINLYEQGCCCETKSMIYMDGKLTKPQKEGFIYICQDKDGNLIREKTKLERLN